MEYLKFKKNRKCEILQKNNWNSISCKTYCNNICIYRFQKYMFAVFPAASINNGKCSLFAQAWQLNDSCVLARFIASFHQLTLQKMCKTNWHVGIRSIQPIMINNICFWHDSLLTNPQVFPLVISCKYKHCCSTWHDFFGFSCLFFFMLTSVVS